jgi:hypothetical protein
MEKAVQRAEKALHISERTQETLDHIMDLLKQGRSNLHVAEANRSGGEVKLSQAKSLTLSVLDTIGVHESSRKNTELSSRAKQLLEKDGDGDDDSSHKLTFKNLNDLSRNTTNVMKPAAMGPLHRVTSEKGEEMSKSINPMRMTSGDSDATENYAMGSSVDQENIIDNDDKNDGFNLNKEEEILLVMRETWMKDEALLAEISRQRQTIEESLR